MIWLKRIATLVIILMIGLFALQWAASETTGEVVVLTTTDAAGANHETRLWVADHDGSVWLRAGSEGTSWFQRLQVNPTISLTRNGESKRYTAMPMRDASKTINELLSAKYSWGDKVISKLIDRSAAIAVKLEPLSLEK